MKLILLSNSSTFNPKLNFNFDLIDINANLQLMEISEKQSIIEICRWSPTPDNCQPWTFEWKENSLHISHNDEKSKHPLNPQNMTSYLMLGCLVETIQIAASKFGYSISNEYFLNSHGQWCAVHFFKEPIQVDPLLNSVFERCTDRRIYNKKLNASIDFQKIRTNFGKSQLHLCQNLSIELKDYIIESEQFLIQHESILPSVMKWVRFSKKEAIESKDGFTWKNMLAKIWEVPALRLIRKYPHLLKFMRGNLKTQHRQRTIDQITSADGLICVSIPTNSQNPLIDIIDSGRSILRVWLELTQLKMGVQPLSLSSLPILFRHMNVCDSFFTEKKEIIHSGENILRKNFQIEESRLPIWMIRFGNIEPLPSDLRTYRKDVESLIKVS